MLNNTDSFKHLYIVSGIYGNTIILGNDFDFILPIPGIIEKKRYN